MKISIIGTGYVGLVTGACFADIGHEVVCIDTNQEKIDLLIEGILPFHENGLEEMIMRNTLSKNLKFSSSYSTAAENEIFFICVDTPNDQLGKPDLANLNNVIDSLLQSINKNSLVVIKSTVPLGTIGMIQEIFDNFLQDLNFEVEVCSNPEFLREGNAISDFLQPDRIVVGANSTNAIKKLRKIYAPLKIKEKSFFSMSIESSELTKYASNCFLATKISFMNEISQIADSANANIHEIKEAMGADKRIGDLFLNSGIGFGGSCFPKDLEALVSSQKQFNLKNGILKKVIDVNKNQLDFFIDKIMLVLKKRNLSKINIAIWGTSFKPNTDDMRESPAIKLIKKISSHANKLFIFDPVCSSERIKKELIEINNANIVEEKYQATQFSDALIICTEWKEFAELDYTKLSNTIVFDGRNMLDKNSLEQSGISYYGIGT